MLLLYLYACEWPYEGQRSYLLRGYSYSVCLCTLSLNHSSAEHNASISLRHCLIQIEILPSHFAHVHYVRVLIFTLWAFLPPFLPANGSATQPDCGTGLQSGGSEWIVLKSAEYNCRLLKRLRFCAHRFLGSLCGYVRNI